MAFQLQLLHASDFEAGIPALTDAVNFSTVINALKDDFANTLILSSGDNYIPGPFFSAAADPSLSAVLGSAAPGRADIAILNRLGIQAAAFGNHEFDLGTSTISSLIVPSGAYQGARFPYLSANLNFAADPNLAGRVVAPGQDFTTITTANSGRISRSAVLTVNGERIGIVGATTPTLPSISSPGPGVVTTPFPFAGDPTPAQLDALAAIIQPEVDALTATGINKVILLSHMQQFQIEEALAPRLSNVDVIIAGGSHQLFADADDRRRPEDIGRTVPAYPDFETSRTGDPVLVLNTAANYRYVGRLVTTFDDNGRIIPGSITPAVTGAYATDAASVAALTATNLAAGGVTATPDAGIVSITNALRNVIVSRDGARFGWTNVFLNGTRDDVRTQETNLGNLTADANLFVAKQFDPSVVISLKNGGGIRDNIGFVNSAGGSTAVEKLPPAANPLAGKQQGEVSQLDIENSLRFNNALSLVTLTAAQLFQTLQHGLNDSGPNRTPGRFPQVAGLSLSFFDDNPAAVGVQIKSLAVKDESGKTLDVIADNGILLGDPNRTFRVATLNFLADGGDAYPIPSFVTANPTLANRVDLLRPTTAPRTGVATFAADGSEQDAFAEYLAARFPTQARAFNAADVPAAQDTRIQNLAVRNDTVFSDIISGSGALFGNNADDVMLLRGDNGAVYGGEGNNKVYATGLNSKIFVGNGNDLIGVGNGNNEVYAGEGNNVITAGNGNNKIFTGNGGDRITLGNGNNEIYAGEGSNTITTGAGNDLIFTGNGNDIVNSGAGDDTIYTGNGNNVINAGIGNDTVFAGTGDDIFVLNAGAGSLTISSGFGCCDRFRLGTGLTAGGLSIVQSGLDTLISAGSDLLATVKWVNAGTITSDRFVA